MNAIDSSRPAIEIQTVKANDVTVKANDVTPVLCDGPGKDEELPTFGNTINLYKFI
jgi:hypothetical protein